MARPICHPFPVVAEAAESEELGMSRDLVGPEPASEAMSSPGA